LGDRPIESFQLLTPTQSCSPTVFAGTIVPKQLSASFEAYDAFLHDLKHRIQTAQVKAALSVNREMILLYWRNYSALKYKVDFSSMRPSFARV
jgi:hypothetical protein